MNRNTSLWVAGVAVVAIIAGAGYYYSASQQQKSMTAKTAATPMAAPKDFAIGATPIGITLEPLGKAQGYGEATHLQFNPRNEIAYADEKGMTLYTYDKDQPGKSNCTAECAATWVPLAPLANAKPTGQWTVIARDDGAKQWAFEGKPIYKYANDVDVGGSAGNPAGPSEMGMYARRGGAGNKASIPPEWHVALFQSAGNPVVDVTLPYGVAVREVPEASAVTFTDARGKTIYAFEGTDPNGDKPACAAMPTAGKQCYTWAPVAAPQLAHPIGDWTLVRRNDGIKQWAYKGKALYTYDGDLAPNDVNGIGVDKQWTVAAYAKYFTPSNITMAHTPGRGKVLATATGQTLYRRDGFAFFVGGHQLYRDIPIRPAVGRSIGANGCDSECLKTWHPYAAPADAQPSGYWSVVARPDGSKQWAYQGFALYTYDGDKKSGDMTGNDIYDMVMSDDPNVHNKVEAPMAGPAALFWTIAQP